MSPYYQPYIYSGKAILLTRYLRLKDIPHHENAYDPFRMTLPFPICKQVERLKNGDYASFTIDEEDSSSFNTIKQADLYKHVCVYQYTELRSAYRCKVLVNFTASTGMHVWINGVRTLVSQNYGIQCCAAMELHAGCNTFVIEAFSPPDNNIFHIQVREYDSQIDRSNYAALAHVEDPENWEIPHYVSDPLYRPTSEPFRIMMLQNGMKNIQEKYFLEIRDSVCGLVERRACRLNQLIAIDTDWLRAISPETIRHEELHFLLTKSNGKQLAMVIPLAVCIYTKRLQEIDQELKHRSREVCSSVYDYITGRLAKTGDHPEESYHFGTYYEALVNSWLLDKLVTNRLPEDFYTKEGVHQFYIRSKLDEKPVSICAHIPKGYTAIKKYPTFLILSIASESSKSASFPQDQLSEASLCFDVNGRGFTGGSYIGEASTLEILAWLRTHYSIDEDRLYIIGASNGGFATWAIAQNHPHLAAGIFPHTGLPYKSTLMNVRCLPIIFITCQEDNVIRREQKNIIRRLNPYKKLFVYPFSQMNHNHLGSYLLQPQFLNKLLTKKRNRFPPSIDFRTERNRHVTSFWITVNGIAPGRNFTQVNAKLLSPNAIDLRIQNTHGIMITIPPQVDKRHFTVRVNSCTFTFEEYRDDIVYFIKKRKGWAVTVCLPPFDYRKGTGLCDVYLHSMRIILPDRSTPLLHQIARNFSRPMTNGIDPQIDVNYPIYEESAVPPHIFEHNLILFDNVFTNGYAARMRENLLVPYDATGYTYKEKRTDGDFVILQVVPSLYDSRRTVLLISTNAEKLLESCLLTRKVLLPYYSNGRQPFTNSELVIYNGSTYLGAYEYGEDLKPIV